MTDIRSKLKGNLSYITSSAHKATTPDLRMKQNVVKDLNNQLGQYFDPFIDALPRRFKAGVEIESEVIEGLLASQDIGEDSYTNFIEERIKPTDEIKNKHL